jgi:hypothetical protein
VVREEGRLVSHQSVLQKVVLVMVVGHLVRHQQSEFKKQALVNYRYAIALSNRSQSALQRHANAIAQTRPKRGYSLKQKLYLKTSLNLLLLL